MKALRTVMAWSLASALCGGAIAADVSSGAENGMEMETSRPADGVEGTPADGPSAAAPQTNDPSSMAASSAAVPAPMAAAPPVGASPIAAAGNRPSLAELTGTVTRIDQDQRKLEVRMDNGSSVNFLADATTAPELPSLMVNDRVQVRYDQTTLQAKEITPL
jgi:hypothetical protein